MNNNSQLIGHVSEGEPIIINNINPWEYSWHDTGQTITVRDPQHNENKVISIWKITIDGKDIQFAAGEFSNNIWGFYIC